MCLTGQTRVMEMMSHLGLRCAPQTEETHSKQGASHQEKDTQDKRVCLLCDCYRTPEGEAQSPSRPATDAPTSVTVSTLSMIHCGKEALGPPHCGKHFPVNPCCFLPCTWISNGCVVATP